MTTHEDVGLDPIATDAVPAQSDSALVAGRGLPCEGAWARLRRLLVSRPRDDRPSRHVHRADFVERAAMAREMHRL